jgi:hypothetical protein
MQQQQPSPWALPYINVIMPSEAGIMHFEMTQCCIRFFKSALKLVHFKNEMPTFLCVHMQGTLNGETYIIIPVQKLAPVEKKQLKHLQTLYRLPTEASYKTRTMCKSTMYVLHMAPLYSGSLVFHVGECPCCTP